MNKTGEREKKKIDMTTQGKKEGEFELVTSASLGVIYSQLRYPFRT
jgi:hypothetical protein